MKALKALGDGATLRASAVGDSLQHHRRGTGKELVALLDGAPDLQPQPFEAEVVKSGKEVAASAGARFKAAGKAVASKQQAVGAFTKIVDAAVEDAGNRDVTLTETQVAVADVFKTTTHGDASQQQGDESLKPGTEVTTLQLLSPDRSAAGSRKSSAASRGQESHRSREQPLALQAGGSQPSRAAPLAQGHQPLASIDDAEEAPDSDMFGRWDGRSPTGPTPARRPGNARKPVPAPKAALQGRVEAARSDVAPGVATLRGAVGTKLAAANKAEADRARAEADRARIEKARAGTAASSRQSVKSGTFPTS